MASILVLGVQVPFSRGGQEVLVDTLVRELRKREHDVDLVTLPLSVLPKEGLLTQAAMWRSLDLVSPNGRAVDLVIATKFPSYFARHPRKSVWLVHQFREAYDLYAGPFSDISDDPRDEAFRRMIMEGDSVALGEASFVSGISKNVVERLHRFNGIQAQTLYPPLPMGTRYEVGPLGDYILSVGRLCSIKRVDLMVQALPQVHHSIRLKIVGTPDQPGVLEYLKSEIQKHHLWDRVDFLGRVSDEDLLHFYSHALAVYYAPYNEDYGYVTLEGMASGKPIITAKDSGGVLEFVKDNENGVICEPTPASIAERVERLVQNREEAERLGRNGRASIESLGIAASWDVVLDALCSPLRGLESPSEQLDRVVGQ